MSYSLSLLVSFGISFIVCFISVPWVIKLANVIGALDDPSLPRKVHNHFIPRMGGLAIALGFFIAIGTNYIFFPESLSSINLSKLMALLLGGILMLGLGIVDDIRGLSAFPKLTVQVLAAGVVVFLGYGFDRLAVLGGTELQVGGWGSLLGLVWIVGITNAVNLIDGLDGLACGIAFIAVLTLAAVSITSRETIILLVTLSLAGGLLGFLFFNFHPAKIFLGDTGSLFIGFILAATGLITNTKSSTTAVTLIPIIILGLPILDTFLAASRRILRGQSPFESDKEHIHHRLLSLGINHRNTVFLMWGFSVTACLTAIALTYSRSDIHAWILIGFASFVIVWLQRLGYFPFKVGEATGIFSDRIRFLDSRKQKKMVKAVCRLVERSESLEELLKAIESRQPLFNYSKIRIKIRSLENNQKGDLAQFRTTFVWSQKKSPRLFNQKNSSHLSINVANEKSDGVAMIEYDFDGFGVKLDPAEQRLFSEFNLSLHQALIRLAQEPDRSLAPSNRKLSQRTRYLEPSSEILN